MQIEDGISNAAEYLAGTGMNDSNDVFRVHAKNAPIPGVVIPEPNVLADRLYILEEKESLLSSNAWYAVDTASGTAAFGNGDHTIEFPTNAPDPSFAYALNGSEVGRLFSDGTQT